MKDVLLVATGQSNMKGNGRTDNGYAFIQHPSVYRGDIDRQPSMMPYLVDLGIQRGVRYTCLNYAVGSASITHYTGRVGATITGSATDPLLTMNMGSSGLSGGTTICTEGVAGFDPFGFLNAARSAITARPKFDEVIGLWSNGESDSTITAADYQAGLQSITNHLLISGCDKVYLGLSSKPYNYGAGAYVNLDNAITAALAAMPTLPVYAGANLWRVMGSTPPLYAETGSTTYVHLTDRGQERHAMEWDRVLT